MSNPVYATPPPIPDGLLEYLESIFPPCCKRPSESLEEHMLYAGKVALIGSLRFWKSQQGPPRVDRADLSEEDLVRRAGGYDGDED